MTLSVECNVPDIPLPQLRIVSSRNSSAFAPFRQ